MPRYLAFTLTGPMASWGDIAPGERRGSWSRPSKSAVLGLVAAALGIRRDQPERLAALHGGLGFAVLVERAGQPLVDYHTAQAPTAAALKRHAKALGREQLTWAESLDAGDLNTVLSQRSYYLNPCYRVLLWRRPVEAGGTEEAPELEILREALERPHYQLSLGRKSCPLSRPPHPEIIDADTIEAAVATFSLTPERDLELWCDGDVATGATAAERSSRRDAWRSSAPRRHDPRAELLFRIPKAEEPAA